MATTQNTLIGRASGSVGNVVFLTWKGINVTRSKPVSVSNPNTNDQQFQRNKFSILRQWFFGNRDIIKRGVQKLTRKKTDLNSFLQINLKTVVFLGSPPTPILKPELVQISLGSLPIANITLIQPSASFEGVRVSWNEQVVGKQTNEDLIYILAWNQTQNLFAFTSVGTQRDKSPVTLEFGSLLQSGDNIHVYQYAVSSNRKWVSDTVYANLQLP